MARYFFNTKDGQSFPDEHGVDLPNIGAARSQAIKVVTEMLPTLAEEFWKSGSLTIEAADEEGLVLFTIDVMANDAPAVLAVARNQ